MTCQPNISVFLELLFQAKTVIPGLDEEQQTHAVWFVEPYLPFNSARMNQLYIKLDTHTVKIGQTLHFKLHLSTFSQKERSYLQHVSYIVSHYGSNAYAPLLNPTLKQFSKSPLSQLMVSSRYWFPFF